MTNKAEPKLTRILTLDVGVTTGYAVLEGVPLAWPRVVDTGNFVLEDLEAGVQTLLQKQLIHRVFTEFPEVKNSKLGKQLREAISIVRNLAPGAENIQPGVWKGYKYIISQPIAWDGSPLTKHQKDAIHMGMVCFQNPAVVNLRAAK